MADEAATALGQEVLFHRRLARPGTVVDVGAHVGDFTLALTDIDGLDFVAIEPLPWALATLRERVSARAPRVGIIEAALSDHAYQATLNVPVLREGGPVWPWASLIKDFDTLRADHPEIVEIRPYPVTVATLDSLGLTGVTALKVDAEGAEYEVLRGGRTLLSTQRPIVSVELEERHRAGCTYAVPALLDGLGYDCFFEVAGQALPFSRFDRASMQRGSPSPASHDYSDPYVNCFYFIPSEDASLIERLHAADGASPR